VKAGKWDNTVVIFTSDNGRPFPGAKPNLWDPGIRLPFVVKEPGHSAPGIASDAMISFADITPTLLDYAGVDTRQYAFHGRSFRSQVLRDKSQGFDTVFSSHTFHEIQQYYPMRMIRTREYKLIWNLEYEKTFPLGGGARKFPDFVSRNQLTSLGTRSLESYLRRPRFELYDMQDDPDETRNLAGDPAYAALLEQLEKRLYQFQDETGDIWSTYRTYDQVREILEGN
jgi:N-sulfoglucosamine sulfohydrolase